MGFFDWLTGSDKTAEQQKSCLKRLSDVEGRAFLELPEGYVLPPVDELVQDARAMIQTNVVLHHELSPKIIGISPIWEEMDGNAVVRTTVVPPEFEARYFSGGGLGTLSNLSVLEMVAELLEWFVEDPGGVAVVLNDTHNVWYSEEAPVRPLGFPYKGHFKLLSLTLADLARKGDAEFNALEWFASLGLPLDEFRHPEDPPAAVIKENMRQRMQQMWDEENDWYGNALMNLQRSPKTPSI